MSLIHDLALGRHGAGYDQRTPHVPLPDTLDTVYAHPTDVPLLTEWQRLGLPTTGALRVIASTHVPPGYVHTADETVRRDAGGALARFYAPMRLALLARP